MTPTVLSLDDLLAEASECVRSSSGPLSRWFSHGTVRLIGPWQLASGDKWQAVIAPYNATGDGFDQEVEGIGASPEEALTAALDKFHRTEALAARLSEFVP